MGYWWEGSTSTAIPPTFTSDVVGQHNKIGGNIFRAALAQILCESLTSDVREMEQDKSFKTISDLKKVIWRKLFEANWEVFWKLCFSCLDFSFQRGMWRAEHYEVGSQVCEHWQRGAALPGAKCPSKRKCSVLMAPSWCHTWAFLLLCYLH